MTQSQKVKRRKEYKMDENEGRGDSRTTVFLQQPFIDNAVHVNNITLSDRRLSAALHVALGVCAMYNWRYGTPRRISDNVRSSSFPNVSCWQQTKSTHHLNHKTPFLQRTHAHAPRTVYHLRFRRVYTIFDYKMERTIHCLLTNLLSWFADYGFNRLPD